VGTSQSNSSTIWTAGGDLSAATVAPASQLAIARPGNNDSTLRVYYQEANTKYIREIMYYDDQASWSVSDIQIPGALEGTRISAISAKPPGDVRLYFQGGDANNPLKEWFMNQNTLQWSASKFPKQTFFQHYLFPTTSLLSCLTHYSNPPILPPRPQSTHHSHLLVRKHFRPKQPQRPPHPRLHRHQSHTYPNLAAILQPKPRLERQPYKSRRYIQDGERFPDFCRGHLPDSWELDWGYQYFLSAEY
jgi:hypothetical protein